METIGKPVYHNSMPDVYGGWMKESLLDREDYYWIITANCTYCLLEYSNKNLFTNKTETKKYSLRETFIVRPNTSLAL